MIVRASGARHLILGTGRDAPDPREAGLTDFPTTTVDDLSAEPAEDDPLFPPDWEARQASWKRPEADETFELVFTSGTTGTPKGVMLTHDNVVASIESFHRIVPPMEHRLVSLLPLSHLLEQAVGLYYALDVGADVLYVRSRNPRVIFDALRDQRVTSMVVVPQVLDLFWSAIEREVAKRGRTATFERLRGVARRLPVPIRRWLFRSIHQQLGGHFRLFLSSGAFLPPALQQGWEDLGVTVLQGYGATETGTGSCTTLDDHGLGTVGRVPAGIEMRLAPDGEIQFRGRTVFNGYWNAPELTKAAFTDDGWYRTGDLGRFDEEGRLILSGRLKDMIVLPNGFNVYPEDIENALRIAGVRDAVVLETDPGRIETIVLALDEGRSRRNEDADRDRGQGGECDARPEPADRWLAAMAGRGLPEDPHAQDQARPDQVVGRGGCRLGPVPARTGPERPVPSVSSAVWISGWSGSSAPAGHPRVQQDRRSDQPDDVARPERRLHLGRAGRQIRGLRRGAFGRRRRIGELVHDDEPLLRRLGQDHLVERARASS